MKKRKMVFIGMLYASILLGSVDEKVKVCASEGQLVAVNEGVSDNRIQEEIMDNFYIDSEFRNEYETLCTYNTLQKEFDLEKVEDLLWPEKGETQAYMETYDGGAISLIWNGETVGLNKGTMRYFKDDRALAIKEILEFAKIENLLERKESGSHSQEEAIEKANKFLEELQLGTEFRLQEIYEINSQELSNLQEILKQNPDYQYFYDIGKLTEIQFDESDTVYCLNYHFYLDNIPVYSSDVPGIEMMGGIDAPPVADAMEATFIISQNSFYYITLTGVVENELNMSEQSNVISDNEIKEALIRIYGDVILTDTYTVTEIEMEYIPVRSAIELEKIEFVPVWRCEYHVGEAVWEGYEVFEHAVRIHALTGERIS